MAISVGGMLGLADKTGRRQQAGRDLQTLRQLHDLKKQGEMEEQQAEVAYQDTLYRIKEQANGLLEGDRIAINKKARELQDGLRSKIKALGGSKKAFLKNGGISDLADYKDQVIGSEQMQVYKNNKINMEKLLMIKEKKMGHLINERDYKAMIQYQKTGKGELSYTGLLNEVEIDETLFEWGKEITADEVLKAGSNRMAIIANYEADTGNIYNPSPGDKDLKAYIKYKGYGGLGKNTAIINTRIARAKAEAKKKATKVSSVSTTVGHVINKTGEQSFKNMTFENAFGINKLGDNILGLKPDTGVSFGSSKGFFEVENRRYKLKGAAVFAQGKEREFAKNYYGLKDLNENGSMTLDPTILNDTYDAEGVGLSGKNKGNWSKNYIAKDLVLGYKSMIQGEPHLIIQSVDKDGKPDGRNNEMYGDGKPSGSPIMLIRMQQDTSDYVTGGSGHFSDKDWYQEIPADSDIALKMMADNFGDDNDLSSTQVDQQKLQTVLDQQVIGAERKARQEIKQENEQTKKLVALDKELAKISEKAIKHGETSPTINSEYFRLITEQFNANGLNRNILAQSFYQAYAEGNESDLVNAADGKMFDQALEQYGLKDVLLDKNVSDDQFIDKYYRAELKANPGDINSYSFATTFKQIYDRNINPDKK